jgi:pimeloyl-ACP methyl ester carboxylesterase
MSEEFWDVQAHVIPASHIRGFSRGVRDESTAHLKLAVKHYVPRNRDVKPGDVTLIMAHGVGSSKESYEPFFDELLHCRVPIRGIWAADVAHHSASYILNEDIIGDEPHWFDSSRDLLQMVNYFQTEMPPPIVGVGQSWGCVTLTMMSIFHPRLFTGIISMEPVFATGYKYKKRKGDKDVRPDRFHFATLMANRKDVWSSREQAREQFAANPYYAAFDPRVFERVVKYDLRDIPSENGSAKPVTLTTPKSMEVYTMMRPDPPFPGYPEAPDYQKRGKNTTVIAGFYRDESRQAFESLANVHPPVLYVWGTLSQLHDSDYAEGVVKQTGTGHMGGGGVAKGQVKETFVDGAHHPLPLEKPKGAAEAVADWVLDVLKKWNDETEKRRSQPGFDSTLNPLWLGRITKL